ncbi:MAG TPA: DNA translocase FtsK [Gemmatimonadaceae bacterium]|nr:DNA translocase FtsK [Gemmatimonadaceae bacterium]
MADAALKREVQAIALLLLAVFLAGALMLHGWSEMRGIPAAAGSFGSVGALAARSLIVVFGWVGSSLLPVALAVHALRVFGRMSGGRDRSWLIFLLGMVIVLPFGVALAMGATRDDNVFSGVIGGLLAFYTTQLTGPVGAWLLFLLALSVLAAATLSWNPIRMLVGRELKPVVAGAEQAAALDDTYNPPRVRKQKLLAQQLEPEPEEMPVIDEGLSAPFELRKDRSRRRRGKERDASSAEDRVAAEIEATDVAHERFDDEDLPTPDLLTAPAPRNLDANRRDLDAAGQRLMDALRTFRVDGELVGRTTGPAVTQFEIEPAPGIKVRQIANLANDLALAMRAQSIRVVAPIPGRGAVGVEVPNPVPEMVAFRELLESPDFQTARAALPIALGKDLAGKPVIADLAKMPHLLIAGATGSGKSVCVNTLITSLLYRHTPRTLRFLMVDPKMVELSVYNMIPHLRHKVVTDNRDAAAVLKWAVYEMQSRYELLAANNARNIQDFNRKVTEKAPLKKPKTPNVAFEDLEYKDDVLPYIVVIIDELADLMMTVQGEVETPLAMLAQKARAIGIHLILATQRPSVNVITGLIKANFPSRIAFRVASQIDSRTILDGMGAESLLGNGDMLFIPPGKSEPARLQGAYISSEDTEQLMGWFEARKKARASGFAAAEDMPSESDILEAVRKLDAERAGAGEDGDNGDDGDRDKLFRDAAEIVIQNQSGSTSLLQRRLKIGYGRAARIMDQLQLAGVLGPSDGPRGRDVLVGLEDLERIAPR